MSQWSTHPPAWLYSSHTKSPLRVSRRRPRLPPPLSPWAQISPDSCRAAGHGLSSPAALFLRQRAHVTSNSKTYGSVESDQAHQPSSEALTPETTHSVQGLPSPPFPNPWLPNQAPLIRTKSLIPTGAIGEFGSCGVQRPF